jgi:hypothetical protein
MHYAPAIPDGRGEQSSGAEPLTHQKQRSCHRDDLLVLVFRLPAYRKQKAVWKVWMYRATNAFREF